MEDNKINAKKLTSETISSLHKKINRGIVIYFFIILLLFVGSLILVNNQASKNQQESSRKQISYSAEAFSNMLAEKIGIVASSDIFLDYLHSGQVTRSHILPDFLLELALLDSSIFSGTAIEDSSGKIIFKNGEPTQTLFSLKICYLDNRLSPTLGECKYRWKIFINAKNYIEKFLSLNKDVVICKNCEEINLLSKKNFGIFLVDYATTLKLSGEVISPAKNEIIKYFILISFIFIFFYFWMKKYVKKIFYHYIEHPIQELTLNLERNDSGKSIAYPLVELDRMSKQLNLWKREYVKKEQNEREISLGKLAAQVAHDIRSPLATINALVKETPEIEEQKRIILRNATQQLNDIANVLLVKYRSKDDSRVSENNAVADSEVIAVLLDLIVSEKRLQCKHLPITIDFNVEMNARGAFAQILVSDFKRVISNIINNAIEAISGKGEIKITLSISETTVNIEISDSGVGMPPELIEKVFDGSITSNKKEGSGIGLVSAYQLIRSWGGDLRIESQLNVGTTIHLSFALLEPAPWFAANLNFIQGSKIIVLDDDQSIHDLWSSRFACEVSSANLCVQHFYQANELMKLDKNELRSAHFLCDYELIGQDKTGLDVIEQMNLGHSAILVTSRYDEKQIRRRCAELNIKILPKNYAAYAPICIIEKSASDLSDANQPDFVLIDDDHLVISTWKLIAKKKNKTILAFDNFPDAEKAIEQLSRTTPIYIDSNLGTKTSGEECAKILYENGFINIYLATGHDASRFSSMAWIKDIVGKEPPF